MTITSLGNKEDSMNTFYQEDYQSRRLELDEIAYAAGKDAGERSRRDAGRDKWSAEDYRAALTEYYNVVDEPEEAQ